MFVTPLAVKRREPYFGSVEPGHRELANHFVTASAALAGLVLVFLGATITAYEQFSAPERPSVRAKYRLRAWMGLGGFVFTLVGGCLAVVASVAAAPGVWLIPSAVMLLFGLLFLLALAIMEVWTI